MLCISPYATVLAILYISPYATVLAILYISPYAILLRHIHHNILQTFLYHCPMKTNVLYHVCPKCKSGTMYIYVGTYFQNIPKM
jgi:hypothetical protein